MTDRDASLSHAYPYHERPVPATSRSERLELSLFGSLSSSIALQSGLRGGPGRAMFLSSLNASQHIAVTHDPDVPLQILAGPGSGKTRVLTSRIAHLITTHHLPPSSICAVTFTNKAANEMRERLTTLIGKQQTSELKMGTFHALCAGFLRRYARLVGLSHNFTVCDADESKKLIAKLLKPYKALLSAKDALLKEGTVLSIISRAKSKGQSPDDLLRAAQERHRTGKSTGKQAGTSVAHIEVDDSLTLDEILAQVYDGYQESLTQSNSLDFDDLLLYGVKLFSEHERTTSWCRHMLVDEFQDTNTTQYDLMRAIAASRCVTVVGDPDQSIYGWRSAEVQNLAKMCHDFQPTKQIFLEENYRSTSSILKACVAIISEDCKRIPKTLHTSHPTGIKPVLRSFDSDHEEATYLAIEIKRCVANMGGTLCWGDFAILLRFNALSRSVENALQKVGIPSRVLGGHRFFERQEIKDLLAYLQLVDNPDYKPAFLRAINVPSKGIGEKTLLEILARADKTKISLLTTVENIHDGVAADIRPPIKRKISSFVKIIRKLRELAQADMMPADLLGQLITLLDFEEHLKKTQADWDVRWENVKELISFASDVEISQETLQSDPEGFDMETEPSVTPLRSFLQASMLSSEGDNLKDGDNSEKVTISTCHAAKGLEWPVVMVPAVEQGTFPFHRSDDIEEERRLLYVAATRAQGLLYFTHAHQRKVAGETKSKNLSEFVSVVANKRSGTLFTEDTPDFSPTARDVIAKVLNRPTPDETEIHRRMAEFKKAYCRQATKHRATVGDISRHPESSLGQPPIGACFISSKTVLKPPIPPATDNSFMPPNSKQTAREQARILSVPSSAENRTDYHIGTSARVGDIRCAGALPRGNRVCSPKHGLASTAASQTNMPNRPPPGVGIKRRLGMGRGTSGYANKKFKPHT